MDGVYSASLAGADTQTRPTACCSRPPCPHLFRYPDVFECVSPNEDLWHAPEAVTILNHSAAAATEAHHTDSNSSKQHRISQQTQLYNIL
jgi:hypothetical protein